MLFKHFLATRFNLRADDWEVTRNGEKILNKEWMEDRFHLFETFCLPSVLNQTNQNFTWCIFFDTNTREEDKHTIRNLTEAYKHIQVLFIDGIGQLRTSLIHYIKSVTVEVDFVITSRFDNDDLLHKDYIRTVQDLFKPQHNMVIDIRSGYQVSIENGVNEIRNFNNSFNQFISLIEERSMADTVFSKWHKHWENSKNVVVYNKKRLWIEMVHNKNYANAVRLGLEYPQRFCETDFGIEGKIHLKKSWSFYAYFFKKGIYQSVRNVKRIVKKSLRYTVGYKQR